jgi:pimeloyl-ACP methyl ester carboxylesterase
MTGVWVDHLRLNWRAPSRAAIQSWPEGTRLLQFPDALIRVRDTGRGERVVMLTPDAPVVLEHYSRLIELLKPHVRVVCFEFPGVGFSYPRFGFDFTFPAYVDMLHRMLDALEIRCATLAFTCVNALIAMGFAHTFPDRVERLALAQIAGVDEMQAYVRRIDFRILGLKVLATPVLGQLLMLAASPAVARMWFRWALPKGIDTDPVAGLSRDLYEHGGQFCLASLVQGLARSTPANFPGIRCPATVAWGMADRTHARTRKESIQSILPHASMHLLQERGHCPDIEDPSAYGQLLLAE